MAKSKGKQIMLVNEDFRRDFEALLGKYNVRVVPDSEVLEQGKTIAYIQECYIKRCLLLHFEEMIPTTEENMREVDEVRERELNVSDFW
jgi:hypothetical protein